MKIIKRIGSLMSTILLIIIIGVSICIYLNPDKSADIIGYRTYTVLTDSMEPIIPVGSLVISRSLDEGEEPQPNDIITFHANRFGQDILLTHYFAEKDDVDGNVYYRTHANGINDYDPYNTTYDDLKGIYVYHVPYIGKAMLFVSSPYGIGLLIVIFLLLTIYRFASLKFDLNDEVTLLRGTNKKENSKHTVKGSKFEALLVKNIRIEDEGEYLKVSGELLNTTKSYVKYVKIKLIFQDMNECILLSDTFYVVGKEGLAEGATKCFQTLVKADPHIYSMNINVLSAKKR